MADQIIKVIQELPHYLCYIYPGYLTLVLYFHFRAISLEESSAKLFKAIVISYIYIICINKSINILTGQKNEIAKLITTVEFNLLLLSTSVIVAYLLYRLTKSKKVLNILRYLKINTTFSDDEMEAVENEYNQTLWVCVYIKNTNFLYEGFLTAKELENGKIRYFCLSRYRKSKLNKNGIKKQIVNHDDNDKEKVIIYLDNVSHYEIYDLDSENENEKEENIETDNKKEQEESFFAIIKKSWHGLVEPNDLFGETQICLLLFIFVGVFCAAINVFQIYPKGVTIFFEVVLIDVFLVSLFNLFYNKVNEKIIFRKIIKPFITLSGIVLFLISIFIIIITIPLKKLLYKIQLELFKEFYYQIIMASIFASLCFTIFGALMAKASIWIDKVLFAGAEWLDSGYVNEWFFLIFISLLFFNFIFKKILLLFAKKIIEQQKELYLLLEKEILLARYYILFVLMIIIGMFVDLNKLNMEYAYVFSFKNAYLCKEFLTVTTIFVLWDTISGHIRNTASIKEKNK